MCLILLVKLSKTDAIDKKSTGKFNAHENGLEINADRRLFSPKMANKLFIAELGQGCGCSLLTEEADWNAATWEMELDKIAGLPELLRKIYKQSTQRITFQALWGGDFPSEEISTSLDELEIIILEGRISTTARYIIEKE